MVCPYNCPVGVGHSHFTDGETVAQRDSVVLHIKQEAVSKPREETESLPASSTLEQHLVPAWTGTPVIRTAALLGCMRHSSRHVQV